MASNDIAAAKGIFRAHHSPKFPTLVPQPEITRFLALLDATVKQCSKQNIQV